jgi:CPA1 family monovalent cation:H+ antiporter
MDEIDVVLVSLLLSVVVLGTIARVIHVPYPIVLVIGGLALGVVLGPDDTVTLDPDLVLVIFLPPLLYSSAFFANLHDIRRGVRVVTVQAVGLVLVTMCTVAVVAHELIPGMPWAVAFVLGAIVAPTDALAPAEILRRLRVPRRLVSLIEGESLLNDGTALVAYNTALAAVGATFVLGDASLDFLKNVAGGIAVGLVAGKVLVEVRRRINDIPTEVTISLLSGYAGYLPAEYLHVSGVLAAVTTGIVLGWKAPEISTASMRLQGYAVWEILVFLLNALLFVLIGLQLPTILEGLNDESPATLLGWAAAVSATVILTRLVFGEAFTRFIRFVDRREVQRERRASWRLRLIGGWCGMRGAVSLAAALALGPDFPYRDIVLFLTFAVIFATLVLQGLTLPALIKLLGIEGDDADEREELIGRRASVEAALERIDELSSAEWTRDETAERMRMLYEYRQRRFAIRAGEVDDAEGIDAVETRSYRYQKMVRSVLSAQRATLVDLRNRGDISNEVMHRLERELDLEEERLEIT